MDALFVQPPAFGIWAPPLGLSYLKGYVEKFGFKVKLVDYNIDYYKKCSPEIRDYWNYGYNGHMWDKEHLYSKFIKESFRNYGKIIIRDLLNYKPKYLGFTLIDSTLLPSLELIDIVEEFFPGEFTFLLGGPKVDKDLAGNILSRKIKAVLFEGEAELSLLEYFKKGGESLDEIPGIYFLKNEKVKKTFPRLIKNLDDLAFPDFSDFHLDNYSFKKSVLPFHTTRGCVARCTFCGETNYMRFRSFTPERVVNELIYLKERYNVDMFRFNDSLINGNFKYLKIWLNAIIESGHKIEYGGCQARIDKRMTPELLKQLKDSGCKLLIYGVESGSTKILTRMKKGIDPALSAKVIKDSKKAGLAVQINIIVGHFEENLIDYIKTLALIYKVRKFVDYLNVNTYAFDPIAEDTRKVKNIINKNKLNWRTPYFTNTYSIRLIKRRLVLVMLKVFGITFPK